MNDMERNDVRNALKFEAEECARSIEAFQNAAQLHQFVLNYNPNDGVLPLLTVIRHPACDAGTATYVYWQFSDRLFGPESRKTTQLKAPDGNPSIVIETIEKRFFEKSFASAEIYYDPQEEWSFNAIQQRMLNIAGVDQERLNPIGWQKLDREWLI